MQKKIESVLKAKLCMIGKKVKKKGRDNFEWEEWWLIFIVLSIKNKVTYRVNEGKTK